MQPLPWTRSCFVCGERNPSGLRLKFETDGTSVRAPVVFRPEHVGFKGVVHGGLVGTVLDELMVWGCAVRTRRFAFCAELQVRFLAPARAGESLTGEAVLLENRRDRIFLARGELIAADGQRLATATGKYVPIPASEAAGMWEDFVGDARSQLGWGQADPLP